MEEEMVVPIHLPVAKDFPGSLVSNSVAMRAPLTNTHQQPDRPVGVLYLCTFWNLNRFLCSHTQLVTFLMGFLGLWLISNKGYFLQNTHIHNTVLALIHHQDLARAQTSNAKLIQLRSHNKWLSFILLTSVSAEIIKEP